MIKIKIVTVGKIKEQWLAEGLAEYSKRIQKEAQVLQELVKNDDALISAVEKEPFYICLDSKGKQYTSEEFSQLLEEMFLKKGNSLCFVIGGPEGLPETLKKKAFMCISFSKMTFTHQMVRLILIEQIYRAMEIQKGSPYHK